MIHSALVDRQTDTQTQKQTDTLPVVGIDDDDLLAGCSCVGNDDPLGFSGGLCCWRPNSCIPGCPWICGAGLKMVPVMSSNTSATVKHFLSAKTLFSPKSARA